MSALTSRPNGTLQARDSGEGMPDHPSGAAVDAFGNVYILDIGNDRVRRIDTSGL